MFNSKIKSEGIVYYHTTTETSSLSGWEFHQTITSKNFLCKTISKEVKDESKSIMEITHKNRYDNRIEKINVKENVSNKGLRHLSLKLKSFHKYLKLTFPLKLRKDEHIKENQEPDTSKYKRIYDQILTIIESKELFLDPNLTQEDIIKHIGTNRTYLHSALKKNSSVNFRQLLNTFRIKMAQFIIENKVISGEIYMLADIYAQCGFSSNESFYRIYKSLTGLTPGNYAEKIRKDFNSICTVKCQGSKDCLFDREDSKCLLRRKRMEHNITSLA